MTNEQIALKYFQSRYEAAKDYRDPHWEGCELREHKEYVDCLAVAIKAIEESEDLFFKLTGVMHFVDKWLTEEEKKGLDEVQRADLMREKTLRIVEDLQKRVRELEVR